MAGVEILALEEVVTNYIFNWSLFGAVFAIVFVIFICIGVFVSIMISDWSNVKVGIILGLVFGAVLGTISGTEGRIPVECEDRYKVVISDEVSMNDFLSKYKIIEQEGRIFTVVEKEQKGE